MSLEWKEDACSACFFATHEHFVRGNADSCFGFPSPPLRTSPLPAYLGIKCDTQAQWVNVGHNVDELSGVFVVLSVALSQRIRPAARISNRQFQV